MRMRPSFRLPRMAPPPCLWAEILCRNAFPGKASLAASAGPPAPLCRGRGHRAAAGPGELEQGRADQLGQLALPRIEHRIEPFDARLAELARAIARVHRVEHLALAR